MRKTILKNSKHPLIEFSLVSILILTSVCAVHFEWIPFSWRFIPFLFIFFLALWRWYSTKMYQDETTSSDSSRSSLIAYCIFTLCGIAAILIYTEYYEVPIFLDDRNWWKLLLYSSLFSIPQEFIFRKYLLQLLENSHLTFIPIVILNNIVFSLIHLIYSNGWEIMFITFFLGIGWTLLYLKWKSFLSLSISHTILNFAVHPFCLFLHQGVCVILEINTRF